MCRGPTPHVLIIPVDHHSSSAALPIATLAEMEDYVAALRACFASQGRQLVGFERCQPALRGTDNSPCFLTVLLAQEPCGSAAGR